MLAFILHSASLVKLFLIFFRPPPPVRRVTAAMMEVNRSRRKLSFSVLRMEGREFSPNLNRHSPWYRSGCALTTHGANCDGVRSRHNAGAAAWRTFHNFPGP